MRSRWEGGNKSWKSCWGWPGAHVDLCLAIKEADWEVKGVEGTKGEEKRSGEHKGPQKEIQTKKKKEHCEMRKTILPCSVGVISESDRFWLLCSFLALHHHSALVLNHLSDPLLHRLEVITTKRFWYRGISSQTLPTSDSTLTHRCSKSVPSASVLLISYFP